VRGLFHPKWQAVRRSAEGERSLEPISLKLLEEEGRGTNLAQVFSTIPREQP
jgi:hypothetical protein